MYTYIANFVSMGNCQSQSNNPSFLNFIINAAPKCFICDEIITQHNYICCKSCKKDMHLSCFKKHAETMMECYMCHGSNLHIIKTGSVRSSTSSV